MYDKNGACTTQGCVPEKAGNLQLAADSATSFTSLSRFYSHTCVNESRVAAHALQDKSRVPCIVRDVFDGSPRGSIVPAQVHSPELPKAAISDSCPGSNTLSILKI